MKKKLQRISKKIKFAVFGISIELNTIKTKMGKVKLFEENKVLGGYSLAVRDDWSFKIKRVHVTEDEKNAYIEKFGDEILTYSEFLNWWEQYYKNNEKSTE